MPQVSLNSYKSLLFHGGDTGSIPVWDAKAVSKLLSKNSHHDYVPGQGFPLILVRDHASLRCRLFADQP
jgi:hypothetical protein